MLGIWEILIILLVLFVMTGLVVGVVLLAVWLTRRGAANTPVKPPIQPPPLSTSAPAKRKGRKSAFVEERGGKLRIRWGACCVSLVVATACAALAIEMFLKIGGWKAQGELFAAVTAGVGAITAIVLVELKLARKARDARKAAETGIPPAEPTTPPVCPRCGAALPADAPQGLCPRCVLGVGLATHTETGGESGPNGTKVLQAPPPPADIANHFPQLEILECLGRGGMGVVYKARQPKLNRVVALKILAPEKGADPKFAERFLREAQALARLNHPNIVTVHDFGEAEGLYYLLMEYVDGMTLRQLLQGQKLAPEEALSIVPKICEALQFAHELGVVHRDIKPENVLVDRQGRVKIADFGIAKIVAADQPRQAITQDQVIGTPHYMAPEQVERPQLVDHRADIYSLGVVFYEMLTGELPLGKFQPPSRKVQVDVRLDEVVLHALEKEPERRYQKASEVKTAVETIAATPGVAVAGAAPAASPEITPAMIGRYRRHLWVKAGCFGFAAVCFLIATVSYTASDNTLAALLSAVATVFFGVAGYRHFSAAQQVAAVPGAGSGQELGAAPERAQGPTPPAAKSIAGWMLLLGSCWLLLALVELLGRSVARTQPTMYAFFGAGGYLYPGSYNIVIVLTTLCGVLCLWLGWMAGRGVADRGISRLSLALCGASPWMVIMFALVLGKKTVRWEPAMYAFFGVGSWMYSSTYNLLIIGCLLLAVASLRVIWFRAKGYESVSRGVLREFPLEAAHPSRPWWKRWWAQLAVGLGLLVILRTFFLQPFAAATDAAAPEIPRGSRVLVWKLARNFVPGDLVAYRHDDRVNVGRVAGSEAGGLLVNRKGEANTVVPRADILGKVVSVYWRGSGDGATASPGGAQGPSLGPVTGRVLDPVVILRDNIALDLDAQVTLEVAGQRQPDSAQSLGLDVAWDNDGGGALMRDPYGKARLLPLPDASDFADAAAKAVERRDLVAGSGDRGALAEKCRFFAVLTDQARLAAIEVKEFEPAQGTIRWRFLEEPTKKPTTLGTVFATRFSPTVERVLYSVATQRPIKAEDLDFRREIEVPGEIEKAGEEQFFHWLAVQGADLLAFGHKGSWDLWASPKLALVAATMWDQPVVADIVGAAKSGPVGLERAEPDAKEGFVSYRLGTNAGFPLTFAFQTTAGGLGVLQVKGFTVSPQGVKIRYKLAQTAGESTRLNALSEADRARAVALFKDIEDFSYEFNAAFDAKNIRAAQACARRVLTLLTNFNTVVRGTGCELPAAISDDMAKVRQALDKGDWKQARRLVESNVARYNEAYAEQIRRIANRIEEWARSPKQTAANSFGPVIQRIVNDDSAGTNYLIDLDTSKLFTPPVNLKPGDGTGNAKEWYVHNGIDAMGNSKTGIEGLVGVDVFALQVPGDRWTDSITPPEWEALQSADPKRRVPAMTGAGTLPATYLFKTREGGIGILQILGLNTDPPGVRISYKLVQSAERALAPSSREKEAVPRKFMRLVVDKEAMTFEGQPTTWETVGALLDQVTDRTNTVLECAVTSDQITVQQQNEWFGKCSALARDYGFAYASFIGIHALGSKGTSGAGSDVTAAGDQDFVAQHRPKDGQKALDAARDFVEEHKWRMRSEFGNQGRVVLRAIDPAGKQITFEEASMADGKARFTIIAEPGAELSAERIGAAIWQRLGWAHVSPAAPKLVPPPPVARARAGTYQVTLINGVTVEVVAVTRNPLLSWLWWKPDGTLLAQPPGEPGEFWPSGMWTRKSVGSNDYAILVRCGGQTPGHWQERREYTPRGELLGQLGVKGADMAEVVRFPAGTQEIAVRVATATGPWESVAVFDGVRTRVLVEGIQVLCTHLRQDPDGKCLDVTHNVDRDQYALRMMVRLKNGKRVEVGLHSGLLSARETRGYVLLDPSEPYVRAGDIAEFVLERTPWVVGEIDGIALAPAKATLQALPRFGPVTEWELGGLPSLDCTVLDLDQGRLLVVPTNTVAASMNNPRPMLNWMVERGADLEVWMGAGASLHLDDGVLLRLTGGATFDSVDVSTVRRQLEGGGGAQNVSVPTAEVKTQPVFVYRTREGGMGVLQVLGPAELRFNLRIRYKPVQPSLRAAQTGGSATETAAVERNPEVLRLRLRQAEAEAASLKEAQKTGRISAEKAEEAQDKVELLKAELAGDSVQTAQVKLAAAKRKFKRTTELWKAGRIPSLEYEAAKADVAVRQAELQAALSAQPGAAFGPVIERVLHDPDDQRDKETITLATGALSSELAGAEKEGGGRIRRLVASPADMYAEYDDWVGGRWGLITTGLELANLTPRQWETAMVSEVRKALETPTVVPRVKEYGAILYLLPEGLSPMTFAFRTRQGRCGVLQVYGFTDNPRGLKIRYKLVKSGAADGQSSAANSNQLNSAKPTARKPAAATRATLQALLTAAQVFEVDMGSYPSSLDELVKNPGTGNWKGPYIKVAQWSPVDAWGTAIRYSLSEGNTASPVFTSAGPDRTFDTADDLRSDR